MAEDPKPTPWEEVKNWSRQTLYVPPEKPGLGQRAVRWADDKVAIPIIDLTRKVVGDAPLRMEDPPRAHFSIELYAPPEQKEGGIVAEDMGSLAIILKAPHQLSPTTAELLKKTLGDLERGGCTTHRHKHDPNCFLIRASGRTLEILNPIIQQCPGISDAIRRKDYWAEPSEVEIRDLSALTGLVIDRQLEHSGQLAPEDKRKAETDPPPPRKRTIRLRREEGHGPGNDPRRS